MLNEGAALCKAVSTAIHSSSILVALRALALSLRSADKSLPTKSERQRREGGRGAASSSNLYMRGYNAVPRYFSSYEKGVNGVLRK